MRAHFPCQAWYDDQVWYPLGRHVGSTTYPGLQLTAWGLHRALTEYAGVDISLHDVCVFIPAGFGAVATIFTGLLSWECTGSADAATAATFFMAILPAHLMRSVAGGFDNESIAISAIVATFYFWVRSIRHPTSWPWGLLTGLGYSYMVAAWGGYVFVLNMIGIHAGVLVLLGRFSSQVSYVLTSTTFLASFLTSTSLCTALLTSPQFTIPSSPPRPPRPLPFAAPPRVHPLVHPRHGGRHLRPRALPRRLAALPEHGAARPSRGLRRAPTSHAVPQHPQVRV